MQSVVGKCDDTFRLGYFSEESDSLARNLNEGDADFDVVP
jgi:hypothetical protein